MQMARTINGVFANKPTFNQSLDNRLENTRSYVSAATLNNHIIKLE